MILFRDIDEMLTMAPALEKKGRHIEEKDLGLLKKVDLLVHRGRIVWVGAKGRVPKEFRKQIKKEVSLKKSTVLPGFVECHTHTVFAGQRAEEFELRNQGVSYLEISRRGGGILNTLKKTRATSLHGLKKLAQERTEGFVSQGVTTLEIKSGYGLDFKNELKMLNVMKGLKKPRIITTFLGAHALPPEFSTEKDYLKYLAERVLPVLKKRQLVDRVDIFIEKGFFTQESAREYLTQAKSMGFQLTIHADQLSLSGGTELAIELEAYSADHVICVQNDEIQKLAKSEVTAVLLPTADLYMKCAYPPAQKMIESGVRVALATDFNPGSAPCQDLQLVGLLARLQMGMTLPQVLAAYTVGASFALGLERSVGSLQAGHNADFLSTKKCWQELFYSPGSAFVEETYLSGNLIYAKQ